MPRIVHFEIPADNPERAQKFYGDIFGWKFEKFPGEMEYWMVTTGEEGEPGINGGMGRRAEGMTQVTNTIGVDSIDDYLRKVEEAGGKIAMPKSEIPQVGYVAYFTDPEGNPVGLFEGMQKS